MVSTVTSQQEGPGLNVGIYCVEFACPPHTCVGFPRRSGFLPPLKSCVLELILLLVPLTKALAKIWSWSPGAVLRQPTAPSVCC